MTSLETAWVPDACTLPTVEQPLRIAEFDALFDNHLNGVQRLDPTRVRLVLAGGAAVEATARDLATRESGCCSFFGFDISGTADNRIAMDVTVPPTQVPVLDALVARATERGRTTGEESHY